MIVHQKYEWVSKLCIITQLRKVTKNKRVFPNDSSVFKTLYLALQNIEKRWTMPIREWSQAYQQLLIKFDKI